MRRHQSTTYARLLRPGDMYVEPDDPTRHLFTVDAPPEVDGLRVFVSIRGDDEGRVYGRNFRVKLWD